jgi:hypothetical protein
MSDHATIFDSLKRKTGLSKWPQPTPEANRVPVPYGVRENRAWQGSFARAQLFHSIYRKYGVPQTNPELIDRKSFIRN